MENEGWNGPPDVLAVEDGWVHVFRLRLDLPSEQITALHADLSPEELHRADRYRRPRDGARFTAARGQLRVILGGYTQNSPKLVAFAVNQHGKPVLKQEGPAFNVSHSGDVALVAVACSGAELGIDIEAIRPELDFERMARRFFAPGEVSSLLALPPEQRIGAFFACWTRKEAYMKARGLGLAIPLDGFEVSLTPGEPPRLLRPAADDSRGADWRLWEIQPGPGYAAAICALAPVAGIRCWDWPAA